MAITALPAIVVGMSGASAEPQIGGLIALCWLILVPFSLYRPWAAIALPFVGGALLVFAVFALPFNSAAFVVDFWTSVLLVILGLPKPQRGG